MVILIDRDILSSFCSALDVEWEIISDAAALFYTACGPADYVYCTWDQATGGAVRLELTAEARQSYLGKIPDALSSRRQKLVNGVKRRREVLRDEVTALITVRWLLSQG